MEKVPRLAVLAPVLAFAACTVIELDFYVYELPTSGGTGSGAGSSGTGGAQPCTPEATQSCYGGPPGTEGVGICKAGMKTCAPDGMSWEACTGEVRPQAENCATPEDEDCDGKAPACKGKVLWAKRFGDTSDQRATAIAADPSSSSGNVTIVGYFSGSLDFGGGQPLTSTGGADIFVANLDSSSGGYRWARGYGIGSARAVALDHAGNVFVTGSFSGMTDFGKGSVISAGKSDAFIVKLDPAGNILWVKQFGASGAVTGGTGIAVDDLGYVVVTGSFTGAVDFGDGATGSSGPQDVFLVKLDAGSGAHAWSKHFGDPTDASPLALGVAVDGSGDVILTGYFSGVTSFGSAPLMTTNLSDAFATMLTMSSAGVWSKDFGTSGSTSDGRCVAMASSVDVLVAGGFSGMIDLGAGSVQSSGLGDAYVVKMGAKGQNLWANHFGTMSPKDSAEAVGVSADPTGNVVVGGAFSGQVYFDGPPMVGAGAQDVFLAKLAGQDGGVVWAQSFGGPLTQTAAGVAADSSGNSFLAGYFQGSIDFGTGPLASMGGEDIFVAKFGP